MGKLATEAAGIERGIKQVEATAGKIKNPNQVVEKIERFIQTSRFEVEKLEKYFSRKLAETKNAIFEKANLEHLFGIENSSKSYQVK